MCIRIPTYVVSVLHCMLHASVLASQLGFDVDFAAGKFRVPVDRWEALQASVVELVYVRHGRVQAR